MKQTRVYNTKQKAELTSCIDSFGDSHFTVADVVKRLAGHQLSVSTATVYRFVERLASEGALRKYVVDGTTAACYQRLRGDGEESCRLHFHLKCQACGRLYHLECSELVRIASHIEEEHAFTIDRSKTVFYGLCRDCKASHA